MGDSGWTPLRPKIMVGALEKEEGGEILPGERLTGGERDRLVIDLETTLIHQFLNGSAAIIPEMPVKLPVDALHEAGIVEVAVKGLASPQGKVRNLRVNSVDNARQFLPSETKGKLDEDGFKEKAIREVAPATLVFAVGIEAILELMVGIRDAKPLLIGQKGAVNGFWGWSVSDTSH